MANWHLSRHQRTHWSTNNLAKLIKCNAFGLTNFERY
ncbi:hypothetical protein [Candidatus Poriferisodalis sp.]